MEAAQRDQIALAQRGRLVQQFQEAGHALGRDLDNVLVLRIVDIGIILIVFIVHFLADADDQDCLLRLRLLLALLILVDRLDALDLDAQDVVLGRIEVVLAEVRGVVLDEILVALDFQTGNIAEDGFDVAGRLVLAGGVRPLVLGVAVGWPHVNPAFLAAFLQFQRSLDDLVLVCAR